MLDWLHSVLSWWSRSCAVHWNIMQNRLNRIHSAKIFYINYYSTHRLYSNINPYASRELCHYFHFNLSYQCTLENNFSALEETVRKGKVGVCLALMALPMILNSHNFSVCNLWTADVNECTSGTDRCHRYATCHNTCGSYTCSCNPGYTGNGFSCTRKYIYLWQMSFFLFPSV